LTAAYWATRKSATSGRTDVIPDPDRLRSAADAAEIAEVETTERHLLYVACTHSHDRLLVTAVRPGSKMLEDL